MTSKKQPFFKQHYNRLPFFFRNHKIKKLELLDNTNLEIEPLIHIPQYHTNMSDSMLPVKPISKILLFDEQKKF